MQLWTQYEEGEGGPAVPVIRRISVSDTSVGRTERVLILGGPPDSPVQDVVLHNVVVLRADKSSVIAHARGVRLQNVRVAGRRWIDEDLTRLPGLDSVRCEKWAVCS